MGKNKEYSIMSFNLLYGSAPGLNLGTPQERKDAVVGRMKEVCPDTIGTQECSEWWFDAIREDLGENYAAVGEINEFERQKWRNAIYYRKDKFDLLEEGTKWLSHTPDVRSRLTELDPNTPWGNQFRIMTYVVLRDKETGDTFVHSNTHLGFGCDDRPGQDAILIDLSLAIGKKYGCPVLITGDYNDGVFYPMSGERFLDYYTAKGVTSAHQLTDICNNGSTADYCFVTPESVEVISHDLLPREGISDHSQVIVKFRVK